MLYRPLIPVLSLCLACATANAADLTLNFTGLPSDKGKLMVALYASEAAYKAKDAFRKIQVPARGPLQAVFKDLPAGHYAVAAYHDENGNGTLDKDFMGMPTEAYGFSRNPAARFGPPSFAEMAFAVTRNNLQLDIAVE